MAQREFQLMHFVQGDFEHARNDLHIAGEAARRRINESQTIGRNAAIMRDLIDDFDRRRLVAFEYKRRAISFIFIMQVVV